MKKNSLYNQLINSEPIGFIDPLTDLGEFDIFQRGWYGNPKCGR